MLGRYARKIQKELKLLHASSWQAHIDCDKSHQDRGIQEGMVRA